MIFGVDDVIMLGIAAAGAGLQLFGANEEQDAAKQQAAAAKRAAQKQKQKIKEKIVPLIKEQGKLQRAAEEQSRTAENLRKQQMELDAMRSRREVIRNAVAARAQSLTAAFAQGAQNSSGLFGSLNQITAEAGRQGLAISQNLSIGRGIFAANIAASENISAANRLATKENVQRAKLGAASNVAQANVAALGVNSGSAYSQLGGSIVSSSQTIGKIGASLLFGA